jgi:hypothetical protein
MKLPTVFSVNLFVQSCPFFVQYRLCFIIYKIAHEKNSTVPYLQNAGTSIPLIAGSHIRIFLVIYE